MPEETQMQDADIHDTDTLAQKNQLIHQLQTALQRAHSTNRNAACRRSGWRR